MLRPIAYRNGRISRQRRSGARALSLPPLNHSRISLCAPALNGGSLSTTLLSSTSINAVYHQVSHFLSTTALSSTYPGSLRLNNQPDKQPESLLPTPLPLPPINQIQYEIRKWEPPMIASHSLTNSIPRV